MQLEYSLTRTEILVTFLQGLSRSPRLLVRILILCLLPGTISLALSSDFAHHATLSAAASLIPWTVGTFCCLLFLVFLKAKTARRVMIVTEDGISTSIGKLEGTVAWTRVADVKDSGHHILIVGASGNSFFIPDRAFNSPDEKLQFMSDIQRWRRAK